MSGEPMPAGLREWLAKRLYDFKHANSRVAVPSYGEYERGHYLPRADYFLKAMRKAGFEVIPKRPDCSEQMASCIENCRENGNTPDWCESSCDQVSYMWDCVDRIEQAVLAGEGAEGEDVLSR